MRNRVFVGNTKVLLRRFVGLIVGSSLVVFLLPGAPSALSQTDGSAAAMAEPTRLIDQPAGSPLTGADPSLLAVVNAGASAPGPSVTAGPGEVASVASKNLASGAPSAMELVAIGQDGNKGNAPVPPAPTNRAISGSEDGPVLVFPPSEVDSPEQAKRRRKFDRATSKRADRRPAQDRFDNADGSKTLVVGGNDGAIDERGTVVDADPGLVPIAGGKLRRRVGSVRSEVSSELKDGAEIFSTGVAGARVVISHTGGSGKRAGVVSGSTITYPDAFGSGSSLELETNEAGVKESIILKTVPAPGPIEFRSTLALDGLTARSNPSGSISILDSAGKEQWVIPIGVAYEVPKKGDRPKVLGRVTISLLNRSDGVTELVVKPDDAWLRDPARQYPVVVDPTIQPGKDAAWNAFSTVDSGLPSWHFNLCRTANSTCFGETTPPLQEYAYLRYDTSAAAGKIINSAYLRLNSVNCFSTPAFPATVRVRPLASTFDAATVTWDSRPQARNEEATVVATAAGSYSIDVSPWVAKFASGEWPSFGFRLSSNKDCEVRVTGTGSTFLEITYSDPVPGANRQPVLDPAGSPDGVTVTNPVTVSASAFDPDGDTLYYYFSVCAFFACSSGLSSGWITSNTWTAPNMPNLGTGAYWTVQVTDNFTATVYSSFHSFTGSLTPVAASPQENWAWGMSAAYSTMSTDVQPNSAVNTATKRFVYSATDATVAVAGPALAVQRTYNSADTNVGAFGSGWSSVLDAKVTDTGGNLTFKLPDGRREYHPLVGGVYRTQPGYWSTAAVDPNGGWTLLEKDGTLWRFRPSGMLSGLADRNGRSLALIDDSNTGKPTELRVRGYSVQRSLALTWTGNLVTAITDNSGGAWNYLYAGSNLSKVCDPRNNNTATGLCTTYGYDASNRIVSVTKPKGNKDVEVGYYTDGTVAWRKDGSGNQTSFTFNTATLTETTTDPGGRQTVEVYNSLFQLVSRTDPGDANIAPHTTTYTYDSNGYVSKVTSPVIGSWEYVTDYRGNQIQVKDPTGATSYYAFDSRDNLIAYRDARSTSSLDGIFLWTYGYDFNGNRVRETNPFGWSRTWAYNTGIGLPAGMLLNEIDWKGNVTTYTYNQYGDVASIVYPGVAGDSVAYTYDVLGRKLTETGRLSAPGITYTYDALNAPLTVTEPAVTNPIDGLVHRRKATMTYDSNHLLLTKVDSDVGASTAPDVSRTTTYTYDTNDRQLSMTDPAGGVTSRTYNVTGTVNTTTDPNTRVQQTLYNARNLPQSVIAVAYDDPTDSVVPTNQTMLTMSYDAAGRMTSQTDALGRVRTFTYDGMNRLLTRSLNGFVDRNGVARNIVEQRYTYNAIGNVLNDKRGNDSIAMVNAWDVAGRQVAHSVTTPPRSDFFTLDRNGNVEKWERQTTGAIVLERKTMTFDARDRNLTTTLDMLGVGSNRTVTNSYNKFGLAATITDAKGAVTNFGFDVLGRQTTISTPTLNHEDTGGTVVTAAATMTSGFDAFGNITAARDPRGNVTKTTFDRLNRAVRVDLPNCTLGCSSPAAYETVTYDANGNVTAKRDRRAQTTDFTVDTLNRTVKVLLPSVGGAPRAQAVTHVDLKGNILDTTNAVGAVTSYTYNQFDLPKTISMTDRYPAVQTSTATFDYNDLGQQTWARDTFNAVTASEFLPTGEQTKITDPTGAIWQSTYDALGRTTASFDPLNRSSKTVYNAASESITSQRADSSGAVVTQSSIVYDQNGNATSSTDPRSNVTSYAYDAMNRLVTVTAPNGATPIVTSYGYDRTSNLTRVTNGRGNVTTYGFNQWNLPTSTVEPATTAFPNVADRTYTSTYDAGGLPTGTTEPGVTVARTFNELGFLTAETGSGTGLATATRTFGRDAAGRMTSVNADAGFGTLTFAYNDKNQVITGTGGGAANSTFTYDAKGRMMSRSDHTSGAYSQTYAFSYTARDELATARDHLTAQRTNTWNAAGELTAVAQGTTNRTYTYDSIGRLSSDTLKNGTAVVLNSVAYGYDAARNVTSKTVTAPGNTGAGLNSYTYDQTNRLVSWVNPSAVSTAYAYDAASNRTQAGAKTYTYDQRNQILTGTGETYSWTARGTLASQNIGGVSTTYRTDGLDRLDQAVKGASAVTWSYDGLDRLMHRGEAGVSTWFVYAGLEADPVQYSSSAGSQNMGRNPGGLLMSVNRSGSTSMTAGLDRHGDVTHFVDPAAASVTSTGLFDPFGKPSSVSGNAPASNRIGYQGDWTDPLTGDVLMGARWYNPGAGVFRTRDSFSGLSSSPMTLNRFSYAGNNPLKFSDPSGHFFGGIDLGGFDFSELINSASSLYPAVETVTPSVETFQTGSSVTTISTDMYGSTSFVVTAPTGVTVSSLQTTERSGNLEYTPSAVTHAATLALVELGFAATAIGAAINDSFVANESRPADPVAIVAAAIAGAGQVETAAPAAPLAQPAAVEVAVFGLQYDGPHIRPPEAPKMGELGGPPFPKFEPAKDTGGGANEENILGVIAHAIIAVDFMLRGDAAEVRYSPASGINPKTKKPFTYGVIDLVDATLPVLNFYEVKPRTNSGFYDGKAQVEQRSTDLAVPEALATLSWNADLKSFGVTSEAVAAVPGLTYGYCVICRGLGLKADQKYGDIVPGLVFYEWTDEALRAAQLARAAQRTAEKRAKTESKSQSDPVFDSGPIYVPQPVF
jgi:RHS repeat-associated protein